MEVARRATGATYRWAAEDDRQRLRRFEASRFPEWAPAFAADETLERSIIALDEGGSVVGSLLASDRRRRQLWHYLLGEDSGSIGAVGVDESVRGRGVGTALVAYACEQLRERGVATCHIGWTSLLSFYGRLGFRPWRRFETATLTLGGRHAPR